METWEKEWIRDLAKKQLEMSQQDIMKKRAALWTEHNNLQGVRPMINFEMWTVADDGFNYSCKCTSEAARDIEYQIGAAMQGELMVGDDKVVSGDFVCRYHSRMLPFDMEVQRTKTDGLGIHIEEQIHDLYSVEKLQPSSMSFDIEASLRWKAYVEDVIGDILPVRMGMGSLNASITNEVVHRMGMENMFIAMYDTPDEFHTMMDRLTDDYVKYFKQLEARQMLVANNGNDQLCQGSFGFTTDLPSYASTTKDCWGYLDSQETVNISPEMFEEFFAPYYKKVANLFGLVSYGCCEPVHPFWDNSISKIDNIRKVSISPWCDEEFMGERLRNSNTIYLRKPSPNFVGVGKELDEDAFRKHIQKTLKAAQGCKLEIAFRDTYNLSGNVGKPRRAVEITREEIEKHWK